MRLLLVVALPAVAALAAPATAGTTYCVGTDATAKVCVDDWIVTVDPEGGSISDCVHLGPPPCHPVTATYPTAQLYDGDDCTVHVYLQGRELGRC